MAKGLFDLGGKVTLVTGGNSGIGLGFARGIARQGGDVVIWARNAEKNAQAKAELESYGVRVTTQGVDVTSREAVIEGYEQLIAEHGRVDCVFANSGRSSKNMTGSVLTLEPEEWHDLLAVNLHGAWYTLQEGARRMVQRAEAGDPGGSLVFCGSLSMFHGVAGIANYAASKGGMGAVIRTMAAELGRYGIRANSIAPGYIKTGFGKGSPTMEKIDAFFASKTPIPRPGVGADFEGIAAYLCSDASSFHTGDTIVIDGGSVINPPYALSGLADLR
jgi:NAD(P)-dependent dehydrogenase (short-subunit alcohol dehydrogenase family)